MRLKLANLFATEELKTGQSVGSAALKQGMEAGDLLFFSCHDNLAAEFIGNAVLRAEVNHPSNSLHRQARLCGTWLVVQAAVQNPTVVSGLMTGGTTFLLKKKQLSFWIPLKKLVCRSQANDSAADDCDLNSALQQGKLHH